MGNAGLDDAPYVQRFLVEKEVAATLLSVPHPFEDGMAEQWIQTRLERFEKGEAIHFAITNRQAKYLIGAIGLNIGKENKRADFGFWIGKPYWDNGYCTEAAQAVIKYGFDVLRLNRICDQHMTRNPASGKVMQKIGMKHEGLIRQHIMNWGKFEDLDFYGILRSEYDQAK